MATLYARLQNGGQQIKVTYSRAHRPEKHQDASSYFVRTRKKGLAQVIAQTGGVPSYKNFDDAVVELNRVNILEQSPKLLKEFQSNLPAPLPTPVDIPNGPVTTWAALVEKFAESKRLQVDKGELSSKSWARYERSIETFTKFLTERNTFLLSDIHPDTIDRFQSQRIRDGAKHAWAFDTVTLRMVFSYAVEESILAKTPIKKFKAGGSAERGAQPFTAEEIRALTNQAGKSDPDGLAIWLLYQTGVRLSSAISLTWGDVNGHITRPAMKRGKKVRLPIQPELKALLDAERARRNPQPTDFVLLNHETGKPFTGGRFYEHVKAFGKRAGVTNVHPHRFRDSFACDCLLKSCSTADVAFFLGDTTKTVEAHYAAFVTERAHRADAKVLSGGGLLAVEGTV